MAAWSALAGADAFYSVLGGMLPRPVMSLVRAAQARDAVAAERLDAFLAPLWDTFRKHGSLRVMYVLLDRPGAAALSDPAA